MIKMISNLTKAAVSVATLPIDVAADLVTLGGAITEKDEPYTVEKAKNAMRCIDEAVRPEGR